MPTTVLIWSVVFFVAVVVIAAAWIKSLWHEFIAYEWDHTALIVDGRFARWLAPGRHRLWAHEASTQTVDRRSLALVVPMQEILTADGASVRISASCTYRVVDPTKFLLERAQSGVVLYDAIQIALRETVGERTLEAIAGNRVELSAATLAAALGRVAPLGVELERVEIRDLAVMGELRKAVAAVLQAKLEGQATLEKARAETATLRSLANAARMMDENPNLLNLRLLHTIEGNRQANIVFDPRSSGATPTKSVPPSE